SLSGLGAAELAAGLCGRREVHGFRGQQRHRTRWADQWRCGPRGGRRAEERILYRARLPALHVAAGRCRLGGRARQGSNRRRRGLDAAGNQSRSHAGDPRTEFLNWSLWANTAWDYAANTRGYTDGIVVGYISPGWPLKYGIYKMPIMANG